MMAGPSISDRMTSALPVTCVVVNCVGETGVACVAVSLVMQPLCCMCRCGGCRVDSPYTQKWCLLAVVTSVVLVVVVVVMLSMLTMLSMLLRQGGNSMDKKVAGFIIRG